MRVGIFIDGITLYHGLDKNQRFHFKDFKDWLLGKDDPGYTGYFNCVDNPDTKKNFFIHVMKSGFLLYIRKPKYDFVNKRLDMSNMDIELTVEAILNQSEFNKFILVSGKHDFIPLCEKMSELGKQVEIVGFKNNINTIYKKYNLRYVEDFLKI